MKPDKIKFVEVLEAELPDAAMSVRENIANNLIAAGATMTETAEWKVPARDTHNRPYCTRCGEECLFGGWGFPKWSNRCPNCGAIMTNAKEN